MNRTICSAVLFAAVASFGLNAQTMNLRVTIPFEFHVGSDTLPPGDYVIDHDNGNTLVFIKDARGRLKARPVFTAATGPVTTPGQGNGRLQSLRPGLLSFEGPGRDGRPGSFAPEEQRRKTVSPRLLRRVTLRSPPVSKRSDGWRPEPPGLCGKLAFKGGISRGRGFSGRSGRSPSPDPRACAGRLRTSGGRAAASTLCTSSESVP